jgi:hypothetical protein
MDYPKVERGHILPRVYQRNWAIDGMVELHVAGRPGSRPASTKDVGVKKRAYRRERPDGTPIDDVEWSLSHMEGAVGPILTNALERWPYNFDDKQVLAEFFALQMVRGPRFWRDRERLVQQAARDLQAQGVELPDGSRREITDEEAREAAEAFLGSTKRHTDMLTLGQKLPIVLASMHWTLVQFEQPIIALSDHPVVVWPINRGSASPSVTPAYGPQTALEVRAPISPHLALLMTWIYDGDPVAPVNGGLRHARAINAFTIAQAEDQWLHQIGTKPLLGTGVMKPIAPSIYPRYTPAAAERSRLRTEVEEKTKKVLGKPLQKKAMYEAVRVERKQPPA